MAPEPRESFIQSGSVRLAVRDYGSGRPPIILVHGGPGPNLALWDEFAPHLTPDFRVISYDQRGHGHSDDAEDYSYAALAGDIEAIAPALGRARPIVLGSSWGGQVALSYAARYQRCAGVTGVDGCVTDVHSEMSDEAWTHVEEQARVMDGVGTPEQFEALVARLKATQPPAEFSEATLRRQVLTGPDGMVRWRRSSAAFVAMNRAVDAEERTLSTDIYERIRCPVLLVGAETWCSGMAGLGRTVAL